MRVICDTCAHVYNADHMKPGVEDIMCSTKPHGTLRELTRAEEIWVDRYSDLHKDFTKLVGKRAGQGSLL